MKPFVCMMLLLGTALGLVGLVAQSALARPPRPPFLLRSASSRSSARGVPARSPAGITAVRIEAAPGTARRGAGLTVRTLLVNHAAAPVGARLAIHLLRVGLRPLQIGSASVRIAGGRSWAASVHARLPRSIAAGAYALLACVARPHAGGALDCVTDERALVIGRVRAPRAVRASAFDGAAACGPGARSLSARGARVYPETGNGGYTSEHTDVYLDYDSAADLLLPGTHVVLSDEATQCLTNFSLDFERSSADRDAGPDMSVSAVRINGQPASFRFVQPTYPGDPNGPDDPDPRAHEASELDPVGGPDQNPLPPACTPELLSTDSGAQDAQNGSQCPANKLVITPASPIPAGASFTVEVAYSGRPGVHTDGDGTTEGWFRNDTPGDTGSFVTTEPVGTEDWMPLNDHPSAKPTYDFYDTVPAGKTAIANGELVSQTAHDPSRAFPGGSTTWHWHSPERIASYLVEDSIGSYALSERLAASGIQYYEAQDSGIPPEDAAENKAIMDTQEAVVGFQSGFNGPFPFSTDGIVIGLPPTSFDEEMQTKIAFSGGTIDPQTLNHENMHQWWGDNVSEASYNLTFFKEGLATLGEFLYLAHNAELAAGGPGTPAGRSAFQQELIQNFDDAYGSDGLWTAAPSNPTAFSLFSGATTYLRPGIAYIAVRSILGPRRFAAALMQMQSRYRQATITEPELEAGFSAELPKRTPGCERELERFFSQWFDTAYPSGGPAERPQITGPGLDGPGFHCG